LRDREDALQQPQAGRAVASAPEPLRDPAALRRVLSPRSVAVVGVSAEPASFGARSTTNLRDFAGPVWTVNPKYAGQELHGRPCYGSIADLPDAPDCVLLALPRTGILPAVRAAAERGAGGAIIYAPATAKRGFPTASRRRNASGAGALLVAAPGGRELPGHRGPHDPRRRHLHAEYPRLTAPPGGVAVTSQSGALGYALMQAAERGFSLCHMATAGNATDLDVCDLAAYQLSMPECRSVALAVEGLRDARRLFLLGDAARAAGKGRRRAEARTRRGGRGRGGVPHRLARRQRRRLVRRLPPRRHGGGGGLRRAAGNRRPLRQGAEAESPRSRHRHALRRRGHHGGDHAEALGLDMPQPAPETERVLRGAIPEFGAPRNPCDLTAQVATNPAMFDACMDAMLADAQYGVVVMPVVYSHHATTQGRMESMRPHARKHGKPVCIAWIPEQLEGPGAVAADGAPELPLFRSTRRLMNAIRLWLEHDGGGAAGGAPAATSQDLDLAVASLPGGGAVLMEAEAKALFARAGLPVVDERRTTTAQAAAEAAAALGFPVVLKLDSPDIAHKTEVGGVRLDLGSVDAVREAFDAIVASARHHAPNARVDGVLVQRMARKGVELILGAKRDPQFGSMVLVGTGGVQAELWRDVALDLAPVTPSGRRRCCGA
jgi:acyl-CoA synthetase (NDP forming)